MSSLDIEFRRYGHGLLCSLSSLGVLSCGVEEACEKLCWSEFVRVGEEDLSEEEAVSCGLSRKEDLSEKEGGSRGLPRKEDLSEEDLTEKDQVAGCLPREGGSGCLVDIKKYSQASILLPFCDIIAGACLGIKKNHCLYTQCLKKPLDGNTLCKGCLRQAENSPTGSPPYGLITDRAGKGPDYIDPKGDKAVPYANVAKRLGINIADAQAEAGKFNLTIPESELVERKSKRGRPAKVKSAAVKEEAPKKRGRPKKKAEVAKSQEEIITEMAASITLEMKCDTASEQAEEDKELEIEEIVKCDKEDGEVVEMGVDFQGTIKTINGNKYLITQGLPGDADGLEYVWTIGDEAEMIGTYENGAIVEVEYDTDDDEE